MEKGIIRDLNYNESETGKKVIDGKGLTLIPSFVDMHCHLRDPGYTYKEDLVSGMKAAIRGGYTHLVAMANTNPVIDNLQLVESNKAKAKALDICGLTQVSALTKGFGDQFVDIESIIKGTKLISNDGNTIESTEIMKKALELSKKWNFILATHCQPEVEIIRRDLELLRKTGGNLHICHVSKKESVNMISKAKEEGLTVTCEVTPHHLFDSNLPYRVNPPFGNEDDRQALIRGVKEGIIDVLATDHAPHSKEDKQCGMPGISNIDVAFSMYWSVFSEENIPLETLSRAISFIPSKMLGLNSGVLEVGREANLVLVDTDRERHMDVEKFLSKSRNNPFHLRKIKGDVLMTMKRGVIKYDNR